MKVSAEARQGRGAWAVINCPCTVILSRQETEAEARERAAHFGAASFVYELDAQARTELDAVSTVAEAPA